MPDPTTGPAQEGANIPVTPPDQVQQPEPTDPGFTPAPSEIEEPDQDEEATPPEEGVNINLPDPATGNGQF